tara:strand:- start:157 stop:471 length:315 start_codon:yes stop_codon:yes gene_type:complete
MKKIKQPNTLYMIMSLIQIIGVILMFASIFIWIWGGWSLAWRVGLSAICANTFLWFTKVVIKGAYADIIKQQEELMNPTPPTTKKKSKFQEELDKMMRDTNQTN